MLFNYIVFELEKVEIKNKLNYDNFCVTSDKYSSTIYEAWRCTILLIKKLLFVNHFIFLSSCQVVRSTNYMEYNIFPFYKKA